MTARQLNAKLLNRLPHHWVLTQAPRGGAGTIRHIPTPGWSSVQSKASNSRLSAHLMPETSLKLAHLRQLGTAGTDGRSQSLSRACPAPGPRCGSGWRKIWMWRRSTLRTLTKRKGSRHFQAQSSRWLWTTSPSREGATRRGLMHDRYLQLGIPLRIVTDGMGDPLVNRRGAHQVTHQMLFSLRGHQFQSPD